ncbi:hypothetical protein ACFYZ4_15840 [Streptomyces sp. NPDC001513]|uniref:hypothetical protein n=1 Tax=Streptomyces sp. NPDC001513 TaxID=3364580 RepID=UPI003689727F
MTLPSQQTEMRLLFYRCRIGRSDLDRIFGVASESIPAASVEFSTQMASTRYRQQTLADLVDAIQIANPAPISTAWGNLRLEASDDSLRRQVAVLIEEDRVSVELSGGDATWVYGQAARLREILGDLGGSEDSRPSGMKGAIAKGAVVAIFLFGYWIQIARTPRSEIKLLDMPLAVIASVVAISVVCNSLVQNWMDRAVLDVVDEVRRGFWWTRLTAALKVSVATAAAGVVAALAAIVSALPDH